MGNSCFARCRSIGASGSLHSWIIAMRLTYKQDAEAHRRAMAKLGRDLIRIRRIVQFETVEAHYQTDGPSFSRIWAEANLEHYLRECVRIAEAKPKTRTATA